MSNRLKALQRILGYEMSAIQEDDDGTLLAIIGVGGLEIPIPDEALIEETMQQIQEEETITMQERIAMIEAQLEMLRSLNLGM